MATFYKTWLTECETYEEFKVNIGGTRYNIDTFKQDGYYDVSEYSRVFKGFDLDGYYYTDAENPPCFLARVCHYNLTLFTRPEFNTKNKVRLN